MEKKTVRLSEQSQKKASGIIQQIESLKGSLSLYLSGIAEGAGIVGAFGFDYKKMELTERDQQQPEDTKNGTVPEPQ